MISISHLPPEEEEVIEQIAAAIWNAQNDDNPKWNELKESLDGPLKEEMRVMARAAVAKYRQLHGL